MRGLLAALAALPLPVALLTACGDSGPQTRAAGSPALTRAQAQQVIHTYETTNNRANRALDATLLASVETGPQLDMDAAVYKLRRATKAAPTAFGYGSPTYYIPRLSSYPRWFVVGAVSGSDGTGTRAQQVRHALLFVQDAAGGPWRLAADPYPDGVPLSSIALDDQGYATAVPAGDRHLAMVPGKVSAAHAALLSGGPQAPGAGHLAPGALTTRAYDALQQARSEFTKVGVTLTSQFTPGGRPVYALRTKGGGALVWYVIQQRETYTTTGSGALSVTGDLVGLARPGKVQNRLDTTVLIQYLAEVPAKGSVAVTGMYRKAVQATAS